MGHGADIRANSCAEVVPRRPEPQGAIPPITAEMLVKRSLHVGNFSGQFQASVKTGRTLDTDLLGD